MTRTSLAQLPQFVFHRRPWFIHLFQAVVVLTSLVLAWLLRFDFSLPYRRDLLVSAFLLVMVRLLTLRFFHLNHGWWHFASVSDALNIAKAVAAGSVCFFLLTRYLVIGPEFPRSVYLLEAILTACLLGGARLASRVLVETVLRDATDAKRVLVLGAGSAAEMILRELTKPKSGHLVVGCLDDDPTKLGVHIHGIEVLGRIEQLPEVLESRHVDELLVAIPSATGPQMQRIIEACRNTGLTFKTVPTLSDILRGEAKVNQFREVSLEDLLGREPVCLDLARVRGHLENKTVVVTGAAGSIGSELCRQVLEYSPAELVCVDQNETGMFYLQQELRRRKGSAAVFFRVADVCQAEQMQRCFTEHDVDCVFHAAAYKHVPIMEENVSEAVRNNVFGLQQLLEVAEKHDCKSFVLISSDKAVNPTSIMGATKRICELLLAGRPAGKMRCVAVRFGNVLGSNGSVVPIFQEQLRQGRPLTITHPEIRRFFMTAREAVSLVLQAGAIGQCGDILVLEMGAPIRIVDMARTLIRLSGKREDAVEIEFTGLREGEKLEEALFYEQEEVLPTDSPKIMRIHGFQPDWIELSRQLEELEASLNLDGAAPIRAKVSEIVPQYHNPSVDAAPVTDLIRSQIRVKQATASD